jgi:hypothetical protein
MRIGTCGIWIIKDKSCPQCKRGKLVSADAVYFHVEDVRPQGETRRVYYCDRRGTHDKPMCDNGYKRHVKLIYRRIPPTR